MITACTFPRCILYHSSMVQKQPEEFTHPLPAIVNLHNSIFQDIQVHPLQPYLPHPVSDYRHLKISHSPASGILADTHQYQWAAAKLWCICCKPRQSFPLEVSPEAAAVKFPDAPHFGIPFSTPVLGLQACPLVSSKVLPDGQIHLPASL